MLDEQKLNRKLAEWAGNIKHDWDNDICGYQTTESFCRNCWSATDYTQFPCVPDFTQSLDACFKWLVPQITKPQLQIAFEKPALGGSNWLCQLRLSSKYYEQIGETPALALCLAIEKLIDNEAYSQKA